MGPVEFVAQEAIRGAWRSFREYEFTVIQPVVPISEPRPAGRVGGGRSAWHG